MKRTYVSKNFTLATMATIDTANSIVEEYQDQDLTLTLRQLYYQFVARGLLANTMNSYKRLGKIISDARLAGMIDWDAMEDRTRSMHGLSTWESPESVLRSAMYAYRRDVWNGQKYRPEVWIEKEALSGVIQGVCNELRIDYFPCKGYVSQSMMYRCAQRLRWAIEADQCPVIIHLGDHDPSGIDMTRDIVDRLETMGVQLGNVLIQRIALNFDQIEEYDPPPNPAKLTDTRSNGYVAEFGTSSWELDALPPEAFRSLIRDTVEPYTDDLHRDAILGEEQEAKDKIKKFIENFK